MCSWKKVPDTVIVNIALSFKALAVLGTKGVNQQQSHWQDRSAPVQLGAEGRDIMQSNTIPRQPCCEQYQPKGPWSKLATVKEIVLFSYKDSSVAFKCFIFFIVIHFKVVAQNVGHFLVSSAFPSRLLSHFHAELHLESSQTNELSTSILPHLFNVSLSHVSCIPKPP